MAAQTTSDEDDPIRRLVGEEMGSTCFIHGCELVLLWLLIVEISSGDSSMVDDRWGESLEVTTVRFLGVATARLTEKEKR